MRVASTRLGADPRHPGSAPRRPSRSAATASRRGESVRSSWASTAALIATPVPIRAAVTTERYISTAVAVTGAPVTPCSPYSSRPRRSGPATGASRTRVEPSTVIASSTAPRPAGRPQAARQQAIAGSRSARPSSCQLSTPVTSAHGRPMTARPATTRGIPRRTGAMARTSSATTARAPPNASATWSSIGGSGMSPCSAAQARSTAPATPSSIESVASVAARVASGALGTRRRSRASLSASPARAGTTPLTPPPAKAAACTSRARHAASGHAARRIPYQARLRTASAARCRATPAASGPRSGSILRHGAHGTFAGPRTVRSRTCRRLRDCPSRVGGATRGQGARPANDGWEPAATSCPTALRAMCSATCPASRARPCTIADDTE